MRHVPITATDMAEPCRSLLGWRRRHVWFPEPGFDTLWRCARCDQLSYIVLGVAHWPRPREAA